MSKSNGYRKVTGTDGPKARGKKAMRKSRRVDSKKQTVGFVGITPELISDKCTHPTVTVYLHEGGYYETYQTCDCNKVEWGN